VAKKSSPPGGDWLPRQDAALCFLWERMYSDVDPLHPNRWIQEVARVRVPRTPSPRMRTSLRTSALFP
jgi:hypothetical protein